MPDNYVELLIKSRDEAAPDMERLRERLQELGRTVETARAQVNDTDAAAKLDRLEAKLLGLKKYEDPEIKVSMSGALRAEAQIHMIEASLGRLKDKEDKMKAEADAGGPFGIIGKFLSGTAGNAGGLATASPLWAGLAAALPVLLPEVTAVASGFAAAATGAGAFYLLAHPAINNLTTDYQNLNAAQTRYQTAQNAFKIDPSSTNAKALQAAADNLHAVQMSLTQDAGPAAAAMSRLADTWDRITTAFQPEVFKVFAAGLNDVNRLLPSVVPFASTFADVLTKLLQQAGKFTASTGFQQWLAQFHSLEGPALTAIGQGIGQVAIAIGKLLTSMSAKDVVNGINIAFRILAGAIDLVRLAVHGLMDAWDALSRNPTFKKIASDIAQAWDSISQTGKKKPDFSGLQAGVKAAVAAAVQWLQEHFLPEMSRLLTQASAWLTQHAGPLLIPVGKALIEGLIQGIEDSIPSLLPVLGRVLQFVVEHKGPLDADRRALVPHGQAFMQGLMDGMRSRYPDLLSQLGEVSGIVSGVSVGGRGYGGAGGPGLQLQVTGGGSAFEQFMVLAIRNYVRVRGGNVQSAFGH